MAAMVALLALNFVDEHFNDTRYTRASIAMLSHLARWLGCLSWRASFAFQTSYSKGPPRCVTFVTASKIRIA
jgi:hypothetical protein